jgi:hypothetical protein
MTSKPYLAIVLIVIGLLAFVYQGINYTTREKPVVIGPIEITTEKKVSHSTSADHRCRDTTGWYRAFVPPIAPFFVSLRANSFDTASTPAIVKEY